MERRILEGIDACRPGSDDLRATDLSDVARQVERDPAAQAAYQRVQRADAAIAGAVNEVAVLDGLAQRILERLEAARPTFLSAHERSQLEPSRRLISRGRFSRRRFSRRQWLAAGSTLAAAVLVAVGLGNWLGGGPDSSLETMADGWLHGLGPTWHAMNKTPQGFDVPLAISAAPAGWQRIGRLASGRGVAYQLVHPTAGTAKLFVARLSVGGLPSAPPAAPQSTTGGKAVSYWQNGPLLYVLIVDGGERSYRAFVSTVPTPLA